MGKNRSSYEQIKILLTCAIRGSSSSTSHLEMLGKLLALLLLLQSELLLLHGTLLLGHLLLLRVAASVIVASRRARGTVRIATEK